MTSHTPSFLYLCKARFFVPAYFSAFRAAGVEGAAGRRVRRTWHISRKHGYVAGASRLTVRSRKKRLRIWMGRIRADLGLCPYFQQISQIHDTYPVRKIRNHIQIMGNEQKRQRKILFQLTEQIQYLRLYRNIQSRNRLVCHHKPGGTAPKPARY